MSRDSIRSRWWSRDVPAAAWTLAMGLSLTATVEVESRSPAWGFLVDLHADKLGHIGLVAVHALLLARAFASFSARPRRLAVLLAVVYAIVLELVQGAIPGRQSSLADAIADLAGGVGAVAWWRLLAWRQFRRPAERAGLIASRQVDGS